MAYDERLTERVLDILGAEPSLVQKRMFGGVALMLQGNLACGVIRDDLIVRVPKDEYEAALAQPHVREMDFTGRPMRGWVVVGPEGNGRRRVAAGLGGHRRCVRAEPAAQVTLIPSPYKGRGRGVRVLRGGEVCALVPSPSMRGRLGWRRRRPPAFPREDAAR